MSYVHEFRALFDAMGQYRQGSLYWHVLAPWTEQHSEIRNWLSEFATRPGQPFPEAEIEERESLYALSRINETLLLRFQHGRADGTDWQGYEISQEEHGAFLRSLGFEVSTVSTFSPFYHEIVEVDQSTNDEQPISLIGECWPCYTLGNMMFSRAGVVVTAGRNHAVKEVAETSALYWAYRRKNRIVRDLSQGWGSNSQWATSLRRDYRISNRLYFNVDGRHDLANPEGKDENWLGLTKAERTELLIHRCFVTSIRPNDDLFPYLDKCIVEV